jgi:hypothetical protein
MATGQPLRRPWSPTVRLAGVAVLMAVLLSAAFVDLQGDPAPVTSADARPGSSPTGRADPSDQVQQDRAPVGGLLPNLRVLPAEELKLDVLGPSRTLRFASILVNVGDGPLQVRPRPAESCPPRQRYVVQTVVLDSDGDGEFVGDRDTANASLPGGCMLFHPQHDHWHFDGSARYALTAVGDDVPIVARKKVSFCLRDSERLRGAVDRDLRAHADCARNRPQGISVGWADRYDASLPGQTLELPPSLRDGSYCLRLTADPFDQFVETEEGDNSSAIVVRIDGRTVERDRTLSC